MNTVKAIAAALLLLLVGSAQAQTQYEVLFQVHMGVQWLAGNFDPSSADDHVYARGSFNGWGTDNEMAQSFVNDSLYEALILMNLIPNVDTVAYKYMYTSVAAGDVWEGGSDRKFWATGNETDPDGNGILNIFIPVRFFDNIGYDDIFTDDTPIVFEVDMRPAYAFLADSGAITFPPGSGNNVTGIDSVYLASGAINTTPSMAWVWDLPQGDPLLDSLIMNDDGVDGDAVAGDSIFSITVTFHPGAAKAMTWKHGIGPRDNEAGFQEDYAANVAQPDGRVSDCWGSTTVGSSGWYAAYQGFCTVGIEPLALNEVAKSFELRQNYPNPFNPNTTIEFALTEKADVKLVVYNVLGEQVRTLVNESVVPGSYRVQWDGKNEAGQKVSSGVYLYRLTAGNHAQTQKMIMMK
jgi:hypothetical protein